MSTMSKEILPPPGVIAIWIDPQGRVIRSAADFDRSAPGGYALSEGQAYRATQSVKWAAVKAFCSPVLTDALGGYTLEEIAEAMLAKGHKIALVAIGHSEDERERVERS